MPAVDRQDAPTGVLLVNLGSPDAPTPEALRVYLAQFLSDRRVVDWPRWLWWPILHGIILRTRPPRSAALYRRVWTEDGSPLVHITREQARLLGASLGEGFRVEVAMRYGNPSLAAGFAALERAGCRRVTVLPMFPQEAAATRGSVAAAVADLAPAVEVHLVPSHPTHPGYIDALALQVEQGPQVDHMVLSFHGIPERVVRRGDPYQRECRATAEALARRLGWGPEDHSVVYQSRFGPEAWLQPYASEAVPALADRHARIGIMTPGFTADCLETIDEIGRELAAEVHEAGAELVRIPCLDTEPRWIEALTELVLTR